MPLKTSCGDLGEPYAIYTPLGWAMYGIPGKLQGEDKVLAHFCKSYAVVKDGAEDLEEQFKSYVRMDFSENRNKTVLTFWMPYYNAEVSPSPCGRSVVRL